MPIKPIAGLALALLLAACGRGEAGPDTGAASPAESAAPAGPTAGEREYAELTATWSPAAIEGCGRVLNEALGTRDLVQGALNSVRDPEGRAAVEVEDARHWIGEGNRMLDEIRPKLAAGTCDGSVTVALDEAVQFYVKAGTSAIQAGQIAGS